jgi:hypothetical protein
VSMPLFFSMLGLERAFSKLPSTEQHRTWFKKLEVGMGVLTCTEVIELYLSLCSREHSPGHRERTDFVYGLDLFDHEAPRCLQQKPIAITPTS